ncbi:hypothetical protein DPMN_071194 [Dreissena polymorpha]|uniref:Cadherin domain-containing protein n=1 Tax=Dreissena polymorpha TaxID=45954 RepID=A0A9D3Z247_DREPO|nr:hypothetical protein DPMN_071194 [Dreissena polymorpha]
MCDIKRSGISFTNNSATDGSLSELSVPLTLDIEDENDNTPHKSRCVNSVTILKLTLTRPGNLNPVTTPTYTLTVQASDGKTFNTTTVTVHVVGMQQDYSACRKVVMV